MRKSPRKLFFFMQITGFDENKAYVLKAIEKYPQMSRQLALFRTPSHESGFNQNSMLEAGEIF